MFGGVGMELIVSIIFGSLSVLLGLFAIFAAILISKRTDELVKTEDARAKEIIERGDKRTQEMMERGEKEFRELIDRMDARTARVEEITARMAERQRHASPLVREEGKEYKKDSPK